MSILLSLTSDNGPEHGRVDDLDQDVIGQNLSVVLLEVRDGLEPVSDGAQSHADPLSCCAHAQGGWAAFPVPVEVSDGVAPDDPIPDSRFSSSSQVVTALHQLLVTGVHCPLDGSPPLAQRHMGPGQLLGIPLVLRLDLLEHGHDVLPVDMDSLQGGGFVLEVDATNPFSGSKSDGFSQNTWPKSRGGHQC